MSNLPVSIFSPAMPPNLLAVSYDLRVFGQNYPGLIAELERLGGLRVQQSLWWVPSFVTASTLRDHLLPMLDGNDSLMVAQLGEISGHESRPDIRAWIEVYLNLRVAA